MPADIKHTLSVSPDPLGGRFIVATPHGLLTTTLGKTDLVALIAAIASLPCFKAVPPAVPQGAFAAASTDA